MRRPTGITITTLLMVFALIATVPIVLTGSLARHFGSGGSLIAFTLHTFLLAALALILVGGISMVLWFYFHGRNWARWVVFLLCLLCLVPLEDMRGRLGSSEIRIAVVLYRAITAAVTLIYNIFPAPREWFLSDPPIDDPIHDSIDE